MPRDNFPKPVVEALRRRVADRCSNPNCRVPTAGPGENSLKATNIGIAAHICAASPGGPRYLSTMSIEGRIDISNAIWVCANCSRHIDTNLEAHPVELLKQWKKKAEETAATELGKRLPSDTDAIATLTAAFTGASSNFVQGAIPNVHSAMVAQLQSLDPRFNIDSAFVNGETRFTLNPKEPVKGHIVAVGDAAQEFHAQYRKHMDHGEPIDVDMTGISIKGLPILDGAGINSSNTRLSIGAKTRESVLKLFGSSPNAARREAIAALTGTLMLGQKTCSFKSERHSGILEVSCLLAIQDTEGKSAINFSIEDQAWVNKDILELPFFDTLESMLRGLTDLDGIRVSIEIEGVEILCSGRLKIEKSEFLRNENRRIEYISALRTVARSLKIPIIYKKVNASAAEVSAAYDAASIFLGEKKLAYSDFKSPPRLQIKVNEEFASNVRGSGFPKSETDAVIELDAGEKISAFGQQISLPPKKIAFRSAMLVPVTDTTNLRAGDSIYVDLIPTVNFACLYMYDKPSN